MGLRRSTGKPVSGARAAEGRPRLPARTRLAVRAGRLAAWLSKVGGFGQGQIIGGRVTLVLDPRALHRLAVGRSVILVTGTNGKTTTTLMLSRALQASGAVATNYGGANMPDGLVAALSETMAARWAVLEVDESYLPVVARDLSPVAIVLLNLSRDQLDRVSETSRLESAIRLSVAGQPQAVLVANADDALVTSAAMAATNPIWVGAGGSSHLDAGSCPRCGARIARQADGWSCRGCALRRPEPAWRLEGGMLYGPTGAGTELALALPGRANKANAALAVAALSGVGVAVPAALGPIRAIKDVDGRYQVFRRGAHTIQLLLAKNPAGWAETLPLLGDPGGVVVLVINGREADGLDLSWLWDVSFDHLAGHRLLVSGDRAADLAVRLDYAELPHTVTRDPLRAVDRAPPGPVQVVANYTAFRWLHRKLNDDH